MIIFFVVISAFFLFTACPEVVKEKVATPMIICLFGGNVTISCQTEGATIYYTTDGSTPTRNSNVYSDSFILPNGLWTISAFAVKEGYDDSIVNSSQFLIEKIGFVGEYSFVRNIGSTSYDGAMAVALDSEGNIYLAGYTEGGTIEGQNHIGGLDILIAKYNNAGVVQWTIIDGTDKDEVVLGIAIDSSDNIYVTGYTYGSFGGTNKGDRDFFIAKYSKTGVKQWVKNYGTKAEDSANAIALDNSGNIYVAGYTYGDFNNTNDTQSYSDGFLAKFDINGNNKFYKKILYDWYSSEVLSLAVDTYGYIYVLSNFRIYNSDWFDSWFTYFIRLTKVNSNGDYVFGVSFESKNNDCKGYAITLDNTENNIFITGYTKGYITSPVGMEKATAVGGKDIFIIKFNTIEKKVDWNTILGSKEDDIGYGITRDTEGNIYVTGLSNKGFNDQASLGKSDIFIVKYSPSGSHLWTKFFGGTLDDIANAIIYKNGKIFCVGSTFSSFGFTNNGFSDMCLLKILQ